MRRWRFIDTGARTAAENMALDYVILKCRADGKVPDTLRLLRFKPPAVLIGYHQDVEHEVRLEYVEKAGIHVNRRITGGGAIYFDESSIGWEIIALKDSLPPYKRMDELFKLMCEGFVRALELLGIKASFRPKNDIEVGGRKISGTGGTELGDAILFQGTLLVDFDVETMIKSLKIPIVKLKDKELNSVRERVTCLRWELGRVPSYEEMSKAIRRGFEDVFGVKLEDGYLTEDEVKLFEEKLPYFRSKEWIFLDRRSSREPAILHSLTKKPGGVIRVSLAFDRDARLIKSVLITGDFFAFPPRAIYDLEARLKFIPYSKHKIRQIVNQFFKETGAYIPGVTPDDIADLIIEAVEKLSYEQLGLKGEELNCIYPVTKHAKDILDGKCDYLLLPYCAKLIKCEYRRKEGCLKCGLCTVGDAYELAEKAGLKPVTIQNFEHLMDVLNEMRRNGARGYIGCCCEAFYQKHRDELEEAGIPGIIIDIENKTCYDLGKAEDAYKGLFEAQTSLKINVLAKIVNHLRKYRG